MLSKMLSKKQPIFMLVDSLLNEMLSKTLSKSHFQERKLLTCFWKSTVEKRLSELPRKPGYRKRTGLECWTENFLEKVLSKTLQGTAIQRRTKSDYRSKKHCSKLYREQCQENATGKITYQNTCQKRTVDESRLKLKRWLWLEPTELPVVMLLHKKTAQNIIKIRCQKMRSCRILL